MHSEIRTFTYDSGEIQRVQIVTCDSWESLEFFRPVFTPEAFREMCFIYEKQMVPVFPAYFGELFLFHVPADLAVPYEEEDLCDRHILAKRFLQKHNGSKEAEKFLLELNRRGCLHVIKGKRPFKKSFIPYPDTVGFLSEAEPEAAMKVNSSFFTFDLLDADSPYDTFGTPLGLTVKDGKIMNPPLYGREALLADRDGNVTVRKVSLQELHCSVEGQICERPAMRKTPKRNGYDIVIIGDRVISVRRGGGTVIPSSGFVIHTDQTEVKAGDPVHYSGMENIVFGIQVGNSIVIDDIITDRFISPFSSFLNPFEVSMPPMMYPQDFSKARAPRIALGEDQNHHPVIIWAEGSPKSSYTAGTDSCGASLYEMGKILSEIGIRNAVNLDGGGSAQILLHNKRELKISGRDPKDGRETERPVPAGIRIR